MTTINIQANNLSKIIKGKTILADMNFSIKEGECVALIGPNGAGKTTLMSCLLGDKKVSTGNVLINEQSPKSIANKAKIAFLQQENAVPTSLKVKELLDFFQSIYKDHLTSGEIDMLLGFTESQKNLLTDKLSGGQKRLLAFVLCLIGKPSVLFLDEPTAGMDTSTRKRFWEIVTDLKAQGTTIVYSSHYIEEVEHTADRILVLHQGKLIRDTTPFTMRQEACEKQVTLPRQFAAAVNQLEGIYQMETKTDTVSFMTKDIETVWQALQEVGCTLSDLEVQNKTLLNTLFDSTKGDAS
ncbi:ABC transporter ATP-binding protein [Streptococcus cameli]